MRQRDYQCSIVADVTPVEAFDSIRNVSGWWAKDLKGRTKNLGDEFMVSFGETYVTFRVTESIPGKKIVWLVEDCYLHWIDDKKEWNDSLIRFDIAREGDHTRITMTHVGLVPGKECYKDCESGWNEHFGKSLLSLLVEKEGQPM